ncbi:hypothetical protein GKE82_03570 [Conexibacter sp. W3-3-2]|uniref:hypothetical protein n=1 Tax=Conexibacter sp. W3-3-2 TaxID=2675227 RepID=UPI0012B86C57|nr:hypothetical protein [Conexibacter sp. W3-3-2]MTD43405.1 hypothetical protein [Conexibacter sp. W3-3-2]
MLELDPPPQLLDERLVGGGRLRRVLARALRLGPGGVGLDGEPVALGGQRLPLQRGAVLHAAALLLERRDRRLLGDPLGHEARLELLGRAVDLRVQAGGPRLQVGDALRELLALHLELGPQRLLAGAQLVAAALPRGLQLDAQLLLAGPPRGPLGVQAALERDGVRGGPRLLQQPLALGQPRARGGELAADGLELGEQPLALGGRRVALLGAPVELVLQQRDLGGGPLALGGELVLQRGAALALGAQRAVELVGERLQRDDLGLEALAPAVELQARLARLLLQPLDLGDAAAQVLLLLGQERAALAATGLATGRPGALVGGDARGLDRLAAGLLQLDRQLVDALLGVGETAAQRVELLAAGPAGRGGLVLGLHPPLLLGELPLLGGAQRDLPALQLRRERLLLGPRALQLVLGLREAGGEQDAVLLGAVDAAEQGLLRDLGAPRPAFGEHRRVDDAALVGRRGVLVSGGLTDGVHSPQG